MPVETSGPVPYDKVVNAAIESVRALLPSSPPYRVWRTHELVDAALGRRYAIPLLVLTQNGLWVVHIHRDSGVLAGDEEIWRWHERGQEVLREAPFRELQDLVRKLREALQCQGVSSVEVRGLVLLAQASVDPDCAKLKRQDLVELGNVKEVLLEAPKGRAVAGRDQERVARALAEAGVREAAHRQVVGDYRLGALIADHDVWQEHAAARRDDEGQQARIRTWVLPRVELPAHRASLQRAAVREAEILGRIGQHPHILGLIETVEQGELPRLVFEAFEGALPLHRFLRVHDLTFEQRLEVLEKVADALDHCHRHEVTHRNLSPEAVLVRWRPVPTERASTREGQLEVRVHRFESAVARELERTMLGTRHLSVFTERIDELYRAPEVFRDPDAADESSDLFSLGALARFLFTGAHPGRDLVERARRIQEEEGLHLYGIRDDLDVELDEAIAAATRATVVEREEAVRRWAHSVFGAPREPTVRTWINGVLALYREEEPDAPPVDPLRAEPGQPLGQGLVALQTLGVGATARVLSVQSEDQIFALKVPLEPAQEERLLAEAAVLRRIDHPGVVRLEEQLVLSGRTCLLMQFAGDDTLADLVRKQGTLALDAVHRLGDELLDVLGHLHELGITHRDLKPTNLAWGAQARRLLVFDFSLAALPADKISAGTPGWRDPMLEQRGGWDPAADLYAAAAVLHYALTGERPAWNDRERAVRVVETRFDPGLRGVLAGFFARAFAANASERFVDAADMRHAWNEVFARDITSITPEHTGPVDQRLMRARLDTPVGALGLSARALNALERAGVTSVKDLLGLPRRSLTQLGGVGRETRAEIARAADVLKGRLGSREDAAVRAFLPEVSLLPLPLSEAGLPLSQAALDALHDAGLRTARDLGEAGAERVARILQSHGVDLAALRSGLGAHEAHLEGVLGDWVAALLRPNKAGKRTQWERRVGALFGLEALPGQEDAPLGGRTNAMVAEALGETPAQFRSSFQKARAHWDRDRALRDRVIAAIGEALDRLGPVAPIPEVADALLAVHAPGQREDAHARVQAAALVRFGTEVGLPDPPFAWRLLGGRAWLARSDAALDALRTLGTLADRLAEGDQVVAPETAQRELLAAAAGTPLELLEPPVLVQRAAQASQQAALSPRLELYPRGLSALSAIEMSAAVLAPGLEPEALRKRVAARYPEAEPLPDRPALDGLLERVGLRWSSDQRTYVRPDALASTLPATSTEAWHTSALSQPFESPEPRAVRAERFEVTLQRSLEAGRFRVIQVSARRSEEAAAALTAAVPTLVVTSLDQALWAGLQARIAQAGADPDFVIGVDREGPPGPHWELFVERFVTPVVDEVIDGLLADRARPRLIVHPGLLARYGQAAALGRLVARAEDEEGSAVWLLVPSWDDGGKPLLRHPYGDLPVPIYKPAQRIRAPRTWISRVGETA